VTLAQSYPIGEFYVDLDRTNKTATIVNRSGLSAKVMDNWGIMCNFATCFRKKGKRLGEIYGRPIT
jgi:hypothetical protein